MLKLECLAESNGNTRASITDHCQNAESYPQRAYGYFVLAIAYTDMVDQKQMAVIFEKALLLIKVPWGIVWQFYVTNSATQTDDIETIFKLWLKISI